MRHREGATPIREVAESTKIPKTKRGTHSSLPFPKIQSIFTSPVQLQWAVIAVLIAAVATFRLCELAAMRGLYFGFCVA